MKIRRLPRAIRDVDAIWLHIASVDPVAATRMVDRLAQGVARLADYPKSGPARPDIGGGVRSVTIGRYIVLYLVERESIDIVRVLHGAREMDGFFSG